MGWSYLGGKRWSEVTRDERFFCQRLYSLADSDPRRFVSALNRYSEGLSLDEAAEWEVGFEVCFFRDMRHLLGSKWNQNHRYSPKRTFDLCLFSDKHIVIIEAKAQQSFESDAAQLSAFSDECMQVKEILGAGVDRVSLLMIGAGQYLSDQVRAGLKTRCETWPVSWGELAGFYGDDPVLMRADAAYEPPRSGVHNQGSKTGEQLLALWKGGMREMLVGRQGGSMGESLRRDKESGEWRTRFYEARSGLDAPSTNWFPLRKFVEVVAPVDAAGRARSKSDRSQ